ncbi:roadblock/LC7 domain-containing protein [Streptomyces sp. NPDC055078]
MTDQVLTDLIWLLDDFAGRTPGTLAAVLCSSDGIRRYHHGLSREGAEHLSAIVSGFCSLGDSVDHIPGLTHGGGELQQVVVLHGSLQLLVGRAAERSILAVVAAGSADTGQIGHEMGLLSKRLHEHLSTAARRDGAG